MLKARLITALALLLMLTAILVWGDGQLWLFVLTGLTALAGWEWARLA
ncbi:MAG TPA: phosphatidate cytidylyltransferase, partial [Piscirickettsiaceae bacterium]|nr:phosphatidate cytidylyltransferase [Piscirickettsiaceae bacterium]